VKHRTWGIYTSSNSRLRINATIIVRVKARLVVVGAHVLGRQCVGELWILGCDFAVHVDHGCPLEAQCGKVDGSALVTCGSGASRCRFGRLLLPGEIDHDGEGVYPRAHQSKNDVSIDILVGQDEEQYASQRAEDARREGTQEQLSGFALGRCSEKGLRFYGVIDKTDGDHDIHPGADRVADR